MSDAPHSATIEIESAALLLELTGPHGALLTEVARQSGAGISLRGNLVLVSGAEHDVAVAHRFLSDAVEVLERGGDVTAEDVGRALRELRADPGATLSSLLDDAVVVSPRRRAVVPKTPGQREYLRTIRSHDLTFGIGPAEIGRAHV